MSTVHVLPPSELEKPLDVASVSTRVSLKDMSSESKVMVVEMYSAC